MSVHDYLQAKEAFIELNKNSSLPPSVADEVKLQLIQADIGLKNYGQARAQIEGLLKTPLFPFMYFRTKMLLARLELAEHHIDKAAQILKEQEDVCPIKDWPSDDRILYATIELLRN